MNLSERSSSQGRTNDEMRVAAHFVDIEKSFDIYRESQLVAKEFSYSLETNRYYDADNPADRIALLEMYGDGHSPVYMIAMTDTGGLIKKKYAISVCERCVKIGRIPFIGRWIRKKGEEKEEEEEEKEEEEEEKEEEEKEEKKPGEDVSFAIDHGVSDTEIQHLLCEYKQRAALWITRDAYTTIPNHNYELCLKNAKTSYEF